MKLSASLGIRAQNLFYSLLLNYCSCINEDKHNGRTENSPHFTDRRCGCRYQLYKCKGLAKFERQEADRTLERCPLQHVLPSRYRGFRGGNMNPTCLFLRHRWKDPFQDRQQGRFGLQRERVTSRVTDVT